MVMSYVELDELTEFIKGRMMKGYFGKVTIHIDNGKVFYYEENRTYKKMVAEGD